MKLIPSKRLCLTLYAYVITTTISSALISPLPDTYTSFKIHEDSRPQIFSNQWAVHITDGDEVADRLAQRYGFVNVGKIVEDFYLFKHNTVAKRSIQSEISKSSMLESDSQVKWARQEPIKRRVKREVFLNNIYSNHQPNDPLWSKMWYMNRGDGLDMNVQQAWAEGFTGKGVVVTILDDGLETNHPDIQSNYDPLASYDANDHDNDPMPRYDELNSNRHGTRCAGEVAAVGNNSQCGVGVAFKASIGGVRMLDGEVTDAIEARSLTLNPQHVDIYSASWGPDDDGRTVDGPGELATRAFLQGVLKGRNGKGSIFVWASGNGGREKDNCNCDGYTNSIWTLSISSVSEHGTVPWYTEPCSSTLASTYSSGSFFERQIVTTDLHSGCTVNHTGTSASAPLAAGICALALEANPNLGWRDLQHIVVRTARSDGLVAGDWQVNGVGRKVSHSFGYGVMDAGAMVRLARNWTRVSPQRYCEVKSNVSNRVTSGKSQVRISLHVIGCEDVNFVEHVQARITLETPVRGDIQLFLTSPAGTKSTLLARRPNDNSPYGFHAWPFMSVHFWGESPRGIWILDISNEGRFPAILINWSIIIYGTSKLSDTIEHPKPIQHSQHLSIKDVVEENALPSSVEISAYSNDSQEENYVIIENIKGTAWENCQPGHWDHFTATCTLCEGGYYLWEGRCVNICPSSSYPAVQAELLFTPVGICVPCHYSCLSCTGPNDYDCTACQSDLLMVNSNSAPQSNTERICNPPNLVNELFNYERWALLVNISLAVSLFILSCLIFYTLLQKKQRCLHSFTKCSECRKSDPEPAHKSPFFNNSFKGLILEAQKPRTPEDLEASHSFLPRVNITDNL